MFWTLAYPSRGYRVIAFISPHLFTHKFQCQYISAYKVWRMKKAKHTNKNKDKQK